MSSKRWLMEIIPRRSFQIVVLLAIAVIAITPLNRLNTTYFNVVQTKASGEVLFGSTQEHNFVLGQKVPMYRFNPEWLRPIGFVSVNGQENGHWRASVDTGSFYFPVGKQGSIDFHLEGQIRLNMGRNLAFSPGDMLNIYDGRKRIGKAQVVRLFDEESLANIVSLDQHYLSLSLVGMQVSPYIFSNLLVAPQSSWVKCLQWTVVIGLAATWFASLFATWPKTAWLRLTFAVHQLGSERFRPLHVFVLLLLGLPMGYFFGQLLWYIWCHLFWLVDSKLLHTGSPHFTNAGIWPLRIALWLGFYSVLLVKRSNPFTWFWKKLEYRPQNYAWFPAWCKPYIVWFLHLFVFFAFAYALGDIVVANMRVMVDMAWPGFQPQSAQISPRLFFWLSDIFPQWVHAKHNVDWLFELLAFMLSSNPVVNDKYTLFALLRLGLWSVTICVCLVGYSYTVVCILWSRTAIRNIDFTLAGWVTTAICYGPLLGAALHQATPHSVGLEPIVFIGAWEWLTLSLEFLLNILYTLSIFNLGLMFGVLVDKGVRTSGYYSVIRHPNYTLEALMFVMLGLNALSGAWEWVAISAFLFKYWLRSEREDQFMTGSNPAYVSYKEQTPWKFIPGLY